MITTHFEKYLGIATLGGEVDIFTDVVIGGDVVEDVVREVLRVRGGEAETQVGEGVG